MSDWRIDMNKQKLALLALLIVAALACAGIARAESVAIQNKCKYERGDPLAGNCYGHSGGAPNSERLETWEALKIEAKRLNIKLPKKVVLIDPLKPEKGVWWYRSYWKDGVFYFSVNPGCFDNNIRFGLKRLKQRHVKFDPNKYEPL